MSEKKKAPFPEHVFRPPLLFIFEQDEVLLVVGSFSLIMIVGFFGGFMPPLVIALSFIAPWRLLLVYKDLRDEVPEGFIWHWLYERGYFGPTEENNENVRFVPDAKIREFGE